MRCPKCKNQDTRVVDSRLIKNGLLIRRRRECPQCDYRFNTAEQILREGWIVIKRDGRREFFDENKLLTGLQRATNKRPIEQEQLSLLAADIMDALENDYDQEIPSRAIGELVMDGLKKLDPVAYVRFASVYKDFRDLKELKADIEQIDLN
jgi:transcriptional repressor NrdR